MIRTPWELRKTTEIQVDKIYHVLYETFFSTQDAIGHVGLWNNNSGIKEDIICRHELKDPFILCIVS